LIDPAVYNRCSDLNEEIFYICKNCKLDFNHLVDLPFYTDDINADTDHHLDSKMTK
jgi:hypothetical protein